MDGVNCRITSRIRAYGNGAGSCVTQNLLDEDAELTVSADLST